MTNQIEVNKYEGHTPADAWRHAYGSVNYMPPMNNTADVELIADAPLLLAEVKRLRGLLLEIWKHANECSEEPAEMDETLSAIARALMKEDMR